MSTGCTQSASVELQTTSQLLVLLIVVLVAASFNQYLRLALRSVRRFLISVKAAVMEMRPILSERQAQMRSISKMIVFAFRIERLTDCESV